MRLRPASGALTAWVAPIVVSRESLFARTTGAAERGGHHRRVCRRHQHDRHRRRRRRDGGRDRQRSASRSRATARRSCPRRCSSSRQRDRADCRRASSDGLRRRLCERAHRTAVSSVQGDVSRRSASTCAIDASARSSRSTTTRAITLTREEIERRPKNLWRYRELLPIAGEPRTGFHSGFTPLVRCDAAGGRGSGSASSTSRTTRSTIRRCRTRTASSRSRRRAPWSSASRCSRARRPATSPTASSAHAARLGMECCVFIPDNLEAGQGARLGDLRPDDSRHRRQLRRCEPAVHAGGGPLRLGLREHQPALVLRRRREDDGLRDRRAARLALSRSTSCRRSRAARCCRASLRGFRELQRDRPRRAASCRRFMRRRRPAARRSCTRSKRASTIRNRCSPNTIAKSIAIGNPADGYQVLESVRATGGTGAAVDATSRSSTRFGCLPRPKASSPSRPAARRSPATIDLDRARRHQAATNRSSCASPATATRRRKSCRDRLDAPVRLSRAFKEFEAWWESRRRSQRVRTAAPVDELDAARRSASSISIVLAPFRRTLRIAVEPMRRVGHQPCRTATDRRPPGR